MTPKFMEHIHIDVPKDIKPKFDEFGDMIVSETNKMIVQQVESIDDAICKQIHDMAISNGIDDVFVLDKKNILAALEKQIPKKPTPHKVEVDKIKIGNANWCKGTTVYKCPCCNELISRIYDYCYKCGQALDWSDTE